MTTTSLWLLFAAVGLGTFTLRFLFIYLFGKIEMSGWLRRALRFVPAAALAALEECEDLRLSFRPDRSARPPAKMPLPALEADEKAAQRLRPAWLGFHFEPASTATRKRLSMPDGAVRVLSIVPQSPAATAGLRPGDFLVGAAGEPFTRANPIRPHVVLAPLDGEWSLDIQRGRERQTLRLRPQVAPDNAPVDRTRTVRKRP